MKIAAENKYVTGIGHGTNPARSVLLNAINGEGIAYSFFIRDGKKGNFISYHFA